VRRGRNANRGSCKNVWPQVGGLHGAVGGALDKPCRVSADCLTFGYPMRNSARRAPDEFGEFGLRQAMSFQVFG